MNLGSTIISTTVVGILIIDNDENYASHMQPISIVERWVHETHGWTRKQRQWIMNWLIANQSGKGIRMDRSEEKK